MQHREKSAVSPRTPPEFDMKMQLVVKLKKILIGQQILITL